MNKQIKTKFSKSYTQLKRSSVSSVFYLAKIKQNRLCFEARQGSYLRINQLESFQKSLNKVFVQSCLIEPKIFTIVSGTKKPLGTRMGKGKGMHDTWYCRVAQGQPLLEVSGVIKRKSMQKVKAILGKVPFSVNVKKRTTHFIG